MGVCEGKLEIGSLFRVLKETIIGDISNNLPKRGVPNHGGCHGGVRGILWFGSYIEVEDIEIVCDKMNDG